jgi:putative FmdB family regulatory protein
VPRYDFRCACGAAFEAKRPIEERHSAACPGCGGWAHRQFDPRHVMITVPESLRYVRSDFEPLSTAEHTSSYLAGKVLADHVDGMHAKQQEAAKNHVPFEQYFARKNPDLNLNQPLTRQEAAQVKAALTGAPTHD